MKINLEKSWFIKGFFQIFCLILLIVDFDIYNNKIINESQFKKLKLKPDEGTRFRISSNDNNDINNCLDSEKVNEN